MHYNHNARGSVLLTSLLFALIVAIGLTSYVHMSATSLKLAQRAFFTADTANVCEAGLEQALWSFNQAALGNSAAWASWATGTSSDDKTRTFSGFALSQNAVGRVKVYVKNYNPASPAIIPIIIAEATVTPASGPPIVTKMKSELTRRSLFGRGGVALNGFVFKGNGPTADSWNSKYNDDGTLRVSPAGYVKTGVGANRHDKVTLAAVNVDAAVAGQNADIFGTISIGAPENDGYVTVGPNGRVGPFTTPLGQVDPNSVSYNFTMDVPLVGNPTRSYTNSLSAINSSVTLPAAGDIAASDGKYYYSVPSITLNGNAASSQLSVAPGYGVVIMSSAAITVGGNGAVTVNTGSTLAIYTSADITITGSIVNVDGSAYTGSMQIWGTNATAGSQTIKLSGNGTLSAVAYAPNAIMEVKGGGTTGDIFGSFVGNKVTFTGNDSFHWDESLSEMTAGGTYMPSKWRQLVSAADRALYSTELNSF